VSAALKGYVQKRPPAVSEDTAAGGTTPVLEDIQY
jgi:hypothetical protein